MSNELNTMEYQRSTTKSSNSATLHLQSAKSMELATVIAKFKGVRDIVGGKKVYHIIRCYSFIFLIFHIFNILPRKYLSGNTKRKKRKRDEELIKSQQGAIYKFVVRNEISHETDLHLKEEHLEKIDVDTLINDFASRKACRTHIL